MQLGALDQVLGEVVDHLKAADAWDEGTFVLVSDHGVDVTPPGFGRVFDEVSQDELLRIPLFVKVPGQTEGEIRDEPASTIDVLPSLIGLLGIETDWEMDGHSLYDGSEPTAERRLTSSLDTFFATLERQHPERGTGNDWWSIVAIGDQGDLVSSSVSDHTMGAPSRLTWRLEGAEALADPASAGNRIPIGLRGVVTSPTDTDDEPPDLVVALDGILSGTVGGYRRDDAGWAFTGLLGPTVEGGADDVTAFEVERTPDGVVLHPVAPG
jgi:hypothetical protein